MSGLQPHEIEYLSDKSIKYLGYDFTTYENFIEIFIETTNYEFYPRDIHNIIYSIDCEILSLLNSNSNISDSDGDGIIWKNVPIVMGLSYSLSNEIIAHQRHLPNDYYNYVIREYNLIQLNLD